MDRRKEMRFVTSIKVRLENNHEGELGIAKDCSQGGLKAVFEHFESEPGSHLDLEIQRPNQDSFVSTAAEVRWRRPIVGRWEVGFILRDFFLKDFLPGVKSGILESSCKKREDLKYFIKIISITVALFMIGYFMITTGLIKTNTLVKIVKPKLAKVNIMLSLFREHLSENISKIFRKTYKINGVGYSTDKSSNFVIVNNNTYYPDDFINGGKIINISQDEVMLQFQEKEVVYRVGDIIEQ